MLIPLRNYSNYSICESNIKIDDLVNYAFENQLIDLIRCCQVFYPILESQLEDAL